MKAYITFCKKEFIESIRTYKFIIMIAVFVLLGIMSPMLARILPDLLGSIDMGNGVVMELPESTAMDSWAQFYGNISQIGVLVIAIIFCGLMANEFSQGTLVNILTKGMKRQTVIFSKLTISYIIWTVSYFACFAVTFVYTAFYWELSTWGINSILYAILAFISPWIYGLFLISIMILGGVLFKTFMGALLTTGGVIIVLSLLNFIPSLQKFNPASLVADTFHLLNQSRTPMDFIPALVICIVLTIFNVIASVMVFNKKQL